MVLYWHWLVYICHFVTKIYDMTYMTYYIQATLWNPLIFLSTKSNVMESKFIELPAVIFHSVMHYVVTLIKKHKRPLEAYLFLTVETSQFLLYVTGEVGQSVDAQQNASCLSLPLPMGLHISRIPTVLPK